MEMQANTHRLLAASCAPNDTHKQQNEGDEKLQ